jgi:uncharacterized protein (TIGR02118 family)
MIKAVTTFKRRPDLSVEDFRRHWQTTHAALVSALPGLRRYVQNPAHDSAYARGREPDFDGIAETWFDDTDAMRAVGASEQYAAVRGDEPNFIDVAGMAMMLCEEVPIVDGPVGPFKFVALIRRKPDMPVADFQTYWRTVHGPIAAGNPYIRRYVQNHVRPRAYETGRAPAFDGAAMTWFDSFDDMRASAGTPAQAATVADQAAFLDTAARLPFVVVNEVEVIA